MKKGNNEKIDNQKTGSFTSWDNQELVMKYADVLQIWNYREVTF